MSALSYRSRLLCEPRLRRDGVEHRVEGCPRKLGWDGVRAAHAAEVGEPQGVRTIVFDLISAEPDGPVALRLDAEPGEDAQQLARALAQALGGRARPCLKGLASDGMPTRWYPDLDSFEEDSARELG